MLRALEMAVFCIGPPLALALVRPGRAVLPWLWLGAIGLGLGLWRDPSFDRSVWVVRRLRDGGWRRRLLRWLAASVVLTGMLAVVEPRLLFRLPRDRPFVWALVVGFYPWLSVVPQTLVYRVFFLHRYALLFRRPELAVLAAAFAFALMHLVFLNVWAPLLSFFGGWLFARTYLTTRSAWASALEHALYGLTVMTVGWGRFFYHGSIATVQAWVGP
ncbi:MAG: CPBP family intramembrane metalloprotease [Kiritimatiellae bacterium]|nr:CPBP family intramembrane metalloprotease [Kiritimatiellia bacterium]